MAEPFLGEIRMFGGNFAPSGWALCNGQLLNISQYSALFSLLGTYYGGNGTTNFALPNLQGTVPIHQGTARSGTPYAIGQTGGSESVTLLSGQMPRHNHLVAVNNQAGAASDPTSAIPAAVNAGTARAPVTAFGYSSSAATGNMSPTTISTAGSDQPHPNMQPYLAVTFIIALNGIFPSRN